MSMFFPLKFVTITFHIHARLILVAVTSHPLNSMVSRNSLMHSSLSMLVPWSMAISTSSKSCSNSSGLGGGLVGTAPWSTHTMTSISLGSWIPTGLIHHLGPGMVWKPIKEWDKLPFPQLVASPPDFFPLNRNFQGWRCGEVKMMLCQATDKGSTCLVRLPGSKTSSLHHEVVGAFGPTRPAHSSSQSLEIPSSLGSGSW